MAAPIESNPFDTLVTVHDAKYDKPWLIRLSAEQKVQLAAMIVGLEIIVAEIQGKFKLSRNRSIEDQRRVIELYGIRHRLRKSSLPR